MKWSQLVDVRTFDILHLVKKKIAKSLFSMAKSPVGDLIIGIAFGKLSKLLPVKRIKETDKVLAFWHPKPFWEEHILIVPKKPIKRMLDLQESDKDYLLEVYEIANEIVKELNWDKGGYTLLSNGGNRQEINQLHFHLNSGKTLK